MARLCSLTCAAVKLSLLQGNNLSNSIQHGMKCRTEAVKHLSRSLETWHILKIILSKLKFITNRISYTTPNFCFIINMAMCGLPSNTKSSSHKMWQTSLSLFKPYQIQNLKRKKWGDIAYFIPPTWKSGRHVLRVPLQISPMLYAYGAWRGKGWVLSASQWVTLYHSQRGWVGSCRRL